MTPEEMAVLHSACFTVPRPWSAAEFKTLQNDPTVILLSETDALIAVRVSGPEAEVLTICTHPEARQQGRARELLHKAERAAQAKGVEEVFLEVADTNSSARALYAAMGYVPIGKRKNYYRAPRGERVTAVVLKKSL
ncbi:MAG: GNAT family N-acetyltransferase [Pseudomonadota bacterium]